MDNSFLQAVVDAMRPLLTGVSLSRVWQPSASTVALDFRLPDGRLLLISIRPDAPALFLASRNVAELEADSNGDRAFGALLRKRLRGARVEAIRKPAADRIVTLEFRGFAASGEAARHELVVELTGRSANVILVDDDARIVAVLRESADAPSRLGERYAPPRGGGPARSRTIERELKARAAATGDDAANESLEADLAAQPLQFLLYRESTGRQTLSVIPLLSLSDASVETFSDPNEAADALWRDRDALELLAARSRTVTQRIRLARDRDVRALAAMADDLRSVDGADRFRELAECLLAQQTTAQPVGGGFVITDLYSENQTQVVVEADRGDTPQAVAERLFGRHRKARRTREAVDARRPAIENRIASLDALASELAAATSVSEIDAVSARVDKLLGVRRADSRGPGRGSETSKAIRGARRFVSSDGCEILVGRTSAANDELTFKVARPSDIWLHAADYPGSHVVIRLAKRGEVPHRTLLEAAQLAAYFSQARDDAIVDVRYTERKFVAKPRGAAPGLVRLQRFKSISVRPSSDLARSGDA